jgi:hypothetical protein
MPEILSGLRSVRRHSFGIAQFEEHAGYSEKAALFDELAIVALGNPVGTEDQEIVALGRIPRHVHARQNRVPFRHPSNE